MDLSDFDAEPGALPSDLRKAQSELGFDLPVDLRDLLAISNGLRGDELLIYSAEELVERNSTFEVAAYCPEFVAIGDDGGGQVYLLRRDGIGDMVYQTDMGDMDPTGFVEVGALATFLRVGVPTVDASASSSILVRVVLLAPPPRLKDLLRLKKALEINSGMGELKRKCDVGPFPVELRADIHPTLAGKLLEGVADLADFVGTEPM
tara:strand:+ start:1031 stop:1648 length:618 start_codon:yes stop_codon:yes gene_type:complete